MVRGGLIGLALLVCAVPAHAQLPEAPLVTLAENQLVVTTDGDGDDGACTAEDCSLREAINAANATAGVRETIGFAIPGAGTHVIEPQTALPEIADPVDVDGFTQAGSSANTLASGSNAVQTVVIKGTSGVATGLAVAAAGEGSLIRGLAIHGFTTALALRASTVEGSSLGFDPGTRELDTVNGVTVRPGGIVGGTTLGARNVIAGKSAAVNGLFAAPTAAAVRVESNLLNVHPAGDAAFPQPDSVQQSGVIANGPATITGNVVTGGSFGVLAASAGMRIEDNVVGATTAGEQLGASVGLRINAVSTAAAVSGNLIRAETGIYSTSSNGSIVDNTLRGFGDGPGIRAAALGGPTVGNTISRTAISGFGRLPISLKADDTSVPNDEGDADAGLQNHPVLSSAASSGGTHTVSGTLSSKPETAYVIEVFSGSAAGQHRFLGSFEQTTDAGGDLAFSEDFAANPSDYRITATARDKVTGDTSELSAAVQEDSVPHIDSLTAPAEVAEGQPATISVVAGDPHDDPLTYAFDCDSDGTAEATGAATGHDCSWGEPGDYTVTVTVSDGTASDTDSADVTVTDVAPSVSLAGPSAADEGQSHVYSYVGHGTPTESCGAAGVQVADVLPGTFTCRFPDGPAAGDVSVTMADDGAEATDTITVSVSDVAPVVDISGPATADEGAVATYTWTFSDPGEETSTFTESCGAGAELIDTAAARSFDCRFGGSASSTAVSIGATSGGVAASKEVSVAIANVAPVARTDAYTVTEDTPLTVSAPGVLADDTDAGTDTLTAAVADPPQHGRLVLASDGGFTYTPDADFHGADAFTYRAGDGSAQSDPVEVALTVADVPPAVSMSGPPVADEGTTRTYTYTIANGASPVERCGAAGVAVADAAPGSFTCRFPDGPATSDVSVTVSDGGVQDTDTIAVAVANRAPVATGNAYALAQDATLTVPAPGVLGDDRDPGDDALTATLRQAPSHGTLALAADGGFVYRPDAGFHGSDAFTYRASDGSAVSAPVEVALSVTPGEAPKKDDAKQDAPRQAERGGAPSVAGGPPRPPRGFARGDAGAGEMLAVGPVGSDGRFQARLSNPNPFGLAMRVTLYVRSGSGTARRAALLPKRVVRVGSGKASVPALWRKAVRVKLTPYGRRLLRRRGSLRVLTTLKLVDPLGAVRTVRRKSVTLRPKTPSRRASY